jgi:hypothetical protein
LSSFHFLLEFLSVSNPKQQFLRTLDRPIAFQRSFVRLTGSITAALMLSQAIYWSLRSQGGDGWFWKTTQGWEEETGMTRREQDTARLLLRERGVLQEEKRGMPAKIWFRVDEEILQASLAECANQGWRKAPTKDAQKRQPSIGTESTSETTAEITKQTPLPLLQASGESVEQVMLACGWVNRRLRPMIAEAITLASQRGDPDGHAAERMVAMWRELQRANARGLLRYVISPRKFIAEAHWRTDAMWPYDQGKLRDAQQAAVGAR